MIEAVNSIMSYQIRKDAANMTIMKRMAQADQVMAQLLMENARNATALTLKADSGGTVGSVIDVYA